MARAETVRVRLRYGSPGSQRIIRGETDQLLKKIYTVCAQGIFACLLSLRELVTFAHERQGILPVSRATAPKIVLAWKAYAVSLGCHPQETRLLCSPRPLTREILWGLARELAVRFLGFFQDDPQTILRQLLAREVPQGFSIDDLSTLFCAFYVEWCMRHRDISLP